MSSASAVQSSPVLQLIPLGNLAESPSNPRKHFDPAKLEELSRNIRELGILEPLLVRVHANGNGTTHQIICGHRRYRAARMAGLTGVPATIREVSDDQVRLIQLAENAAREDLSAIEEAEAYAALMAEGMSLGAIAETLGKKMRQVARRLPLAKLPKRVKDALSAGHIQVGHAELIGVIPDSKLQEAALGRFLFDANDSGDGKAILAAVPLAVAKRIVEEEFMTALSLAVFDPEAPDLSPLGACSKCPHLSGNNPDLFGDVKGKAVCTNPKDFHLKTENHLKRLRESGRIVLLTRNEVKQAFPFGDSDQLARDFVDLETICFDDPKRRKYEDLLGRGEKLKTVLVLKNGRVRQLYPAKEIKVALVASGHAFAKEKPKKKVTATEASRSSANLERIGQEAVSRELAAKLRTVKLTPSGWIDLVLKIVIALEGWKLEGVIRRHGYEGTKEAFAHKRERIVAERIEAMTEAERRAFLVDLLVGDFASTADKGQRELYKQVVKLAGVDIARVVNAAIDAAKAAAIQAKNAPKPPIAAKTAKK